MSDTVLLNTSNLTALLGEAMKEPTEELAYLTEGLEFSSMAPPNFVPGSHEKVMQPVYGSTGKASIRSAGVTTMPAVGVKRSSVDVKVTNVQVYAPIDSMEVAAGRTASVPVVEQHMESMSDAWNAAVDDIWFAGAFEGFVASGSFSAQPDIIPAV